jgi:hypothetical protein
VRRSRRSRIFTITFVVMLATVELALLAFDWRRIATGGDAILHGGKWDYLLVTLGLTVISVSWIVSLVFARRFPLWFAISTIAWILQFVLLMTLTLLA